MDENETDLEKKLRDIETPQASDEAKARLKNEGWLRMRKKSVSSGYKLTHLSKVAAFLLVIGASFSLLSYSVTQSTRSGGGDASSEGNLVNSAQITQYPASVRTAIVRMVIRGAVIEKLRFNAPDQFETLDHPQIGVFHPEGGGATFAAAPADIMANGERGVWYFNGELAINGIGNDINDLVAYLVGIEKDTCQRINQELGVDGIPEMSAQNAQYLTNNMIDDGMNDYQFPSDKTYRPFDVAGLEAQPFGCFQSQSDKKYIYYHVLIER